MSVSDSAAKRERFKRPLSNLRAQTAIAAMNLDGVLYYPSLGRMLGSTTAGLMLCQLIYWSRRTKDEDGWIWKTQDNFNEELSLSRREQETARRVLRKSGLVDEQKRGVPARLFYRVNFDVLIEKCGVSVQPSMADSARQERTNPPSSDGGIRQTFLTETTSETTSNAAAAPASAYPYPRIREAWPGNELAAAIAKAYESEIAMLSPMISESIVHWAEEHPNTPTDWPALAAAECAKSNVRKWAYFTACLDRWVTQGHAGRPNRNGNHRADSQTNNGKPTDDHGWRSPIEQSAG